MWYFYLVWLKGSFQSALHESDGWVRLMTVQSYDVVVLEDSQSLSELFLVQLSVGVQPVNLIFFSFLLNEIEEISVFEPLRLDFVFVFSLKWGK